MGHLLAPEPLAPVVPSLGRGGQHIEEVELIGLFFEAEIELQEKQAKADRAGATIEDKADAVRYRAGAQ